MAALTLSPSRASTVPSGEPTLEYDAALASFAVRPESRRRALAISRRPRRFPTRSLRAVAVPNPNPEPVHLGAVRKPRLFGTLPVFITPSGAGSSSSHSEPTTISRTRVNLPGVNYIMHRDTLAELNSDKQSCNDFFLIQPTGLKVPAWLFRKFTSTNTPYSMASRILNSPFFFFITFDEFYSHQENRILKYGTRRA